MPSTHLHPAPLDEQQADVSRERERAPAPRGSRRASPRWWKAPRLAALLLPLGLALAPASADAGRHGHGHHSSHGDSYGSGRLVIDNDRGEPVQLFIDGRSYGTVAPYASEQLVLDTGSHRVELRDRAGRLLERETVSISRRGTAYIELDRVITGRLAVANTLDRAVILTLDGQRRLTLAPYQRTTLTVPVGTVRLELALPDGRVIASGTERIERYQASTWQPRPALLGALRIENPLPIAVTVDLGPGRDRTLGPGGSLFLDDLPEGLGTVSFRRAGGGELVGELPLCIEAFETASLRVPAPRTGIVVIDNERRRSVQVLVDGRVVGLAQPGLDTRLELSPGRHRIELVSAGSGRLVDSRTVTLGRYEPLRLEVPERAHGHERDRWEDEDERLSLGIGFGRDVYLSASFDLD